MSPVQQAIADVLAAIEAGRRAASDEQRDAAARERDVAWHRQIELVERHAGIKVTGAATDLESDTGRAQVKLSDGSVVCLDHDPPVGDYAVVVEQLEDGGERVTAWRDGGQLPAAPTSHN